MSALASLLLLRPADDLPDSAVSDGATVLILAVVFGVPAIVVIVATIRRWRRGGARR